MRIAPQQAQELAHVEFAALDVETANSDPASICQIGIATVESGRISHVWTRLIRPRGRFERRHVEIRGITRDAVATAPAFAEIHGEIARRLPRFVVTHTRFDVAGLTQECRRGRLSVFERAWLDSSLLPNRAWPGRFPRGSRGLAPIPPNRTFRQGL